MSEAVALEDDGEAMKTPVETPTPEEDEEEVCRRSNTICRMNLS